MMTAPAAREMRQGRLTGAVTFRITLRFVLGAGLTCAAHAAVAATPPPVSPAGPVTVSAALTGVHQASASLHGGGDARSSGLALGVGVTRRFHPAFSAGVSARYAREEWRFGARSSVGTPWRHVHRPSVVLSARLALSRTTLLGVSPSVEWAYDSRAGTADALTYGAAVSVARVFSPRFIVGAGAGIYRQFYSVKVSPFVILDWRLTDRLRIANAIPAGPEGGAGVELRLVPRPGWELAVGGVYRSDRLRLPDGGASVTGEASGIPLLARVSRDVGASSRIDLYAGAVVNGRLSLRDGDGDETLHDGLDASPTVALTLAFQR